MDKKRQIEEQLALIEKRLANAEAYVANGVNVEGSAFLHFDDWNGNSGHPLWMKNFMIPATKRVRAKKERALNTITNKEREKRRERRRSPGSVPLRLSERDRDAKARRGQSKGDTPIQFGSVIASVSIEFGWAMADLSMDGLGRLLVGGCAQHQGEPL